MKSIYSPHIHQSNHNIPADHKSTSSADSLTSYKALSSPDLLAPVARQSTSALDWNAAKGEFVTEKCGTTNMECLEFEFSKKSFLFFWDAGWLALMEQVLI